MTIWCFEINTNDILMQNKMARVHGATLMRLDLLFVSFDWLWWDRQQFDCPPGQGGQQNSWCRGQWMQLIAQLMPFLESHWKCFGGKGMFFDHIHSCYLCLTVSTRTFPCNIFWGRIANTQVSTRWIVQGTIFQQKKIKECKFTMYISLMNPCTVKYVRISFNTNQSPW